MKFGDSLFYRSVPEWSSHNIDYTDLKHLIKARTSQTDGRPQTIPGKDNETRALQTFEDELYTELADQHARVNLFVRSKSGEISRRLAHLREQISTLTRKSLSKGLNKITVHQLEKFSKLEDQTLQVGEDILKLKRFVNVNREALRKLLKKYKKWTGSSGLAIRFHRGVLDHPSSFSSGSFEPLLAQHIDTLVAVRQPFNADLNWSADLSPALNRSPTSSYNPTPPSTSPVHGDRLSRIYHGSTASYLNFVNQRGSRVELDAALATVPLGESSNRFVFWMHPENILEVQVLILRHTALRNWSRPPGADKNNSSAEASRRSSVSGHLNDCLNTGGVGVSLIVCDSLDQFLERQNARPFDDTDVMQNTPPERAAACLRTVCNQDVLLTVNKSRDAAWTSANKPGVRPIRFAKFDRKAVRRLFDESSEEEYRNHDESTEALEARTWLDNHKDVQPIVQIQYKRAQFIGLHNNDKEGLWATLDTDVYMAECAKESIAFNDDGSLVTKGKISDQWRKFPNAILDVRVERNDRTHLIQALGDSHLVTRVPGFSLEAHAVAVMCEHPKSKPPHWLPLLASDIRKLPSPNQSTKRQSKRASLQWQDGNGDPSSSAPSTVKAKSSSGLSVRQGESSATSAPDLAPLKPLDHADNRKKKLKQRALPSKNLHDPSHEPGPRYWNEFDDGSEGEQDEPFTILVDPNSSDVFSRTARVAETWNNFKEKLWTTRDNTTGWFKSAPAEAAIVPPETQPLLYNEFPSPDLEDSSDSEIETDVVRSREYTTMPSQRRAMKKSRNEKLLFRGSAGGFAASFIFMIVSLVLVVCGHQNTAAQVDIGVIICVAASLVLAVLGAGFTAARHDKLSWTHRIIVALMLILAAFANAALLYGLDHW